MKRWLWVTATLLLIATQAWALVAVTETQTQTLTNKTLTSPTITSATITSPNLSLQAFTKSGLPAAGTAGRLARVTDDVRGVWIDSGFKWVQLSGETFNVLDAVTGGAGTDADPYTGWAATVNALPAGSAILFPPGTFQPSTIVTFPAGATVYGAGRDKTLVKANFTSAVVRGSSGTTNRHFSLHDITVDNTSKNNVGGIAIDMSHCDQCSLWFVRARNAETGILLTNSATTNANYLGVYEPDFINVKKGMVVTSVSPGGGSNVVKLVGGRSDSDGDDTSAIEVTDVTSMTIIGHSFGRFVTGLKLLGTQTQKISVIGCYFENGVANAVGISIGGSTRNVTIVEPHFNLTGAGFDNVANPAGDNYVFLGNQTVSIGSDGVAASGDIVLPNNTGTYAFQKADGSLARIFELNTSDILEMGNGITRLKVAANTNRFHIPVVATGSLPAAAAAEDGSILIEDNGAGDRNVIIYAGSQRFRIDGGAAF